MHLILTGATGLVGSAVLDSMLRIPDITKISILARRPVQMAEDAKDPRVNVIIHPDFAVYDSDVLEKLKGAKGCVWALGISQTQVNAEYVPPLFLRPTPLTCIQGVRENHQDIRPERRNSVPNPTLRKRGAV
jgi:hypothetical protein